MLYYFGKFWFWLFGWKVAKRYPTHIKKCVMVAAPHTSNWDFSFAMCTFFIMRLRIRFLAKHTLFGWPLKYIMYPLGGIPVNRSTSGNLVDYMVDLFNKNEALIMLIPVEGTRSYVKEWKTGFYHTALKAGVPIVLGYLDYKKKESGCDEVFYPTGNYEADLQVMKAYFSQVTPKYPEKASVNPIA